MHSPSRQLRDTCCHVKLPLILISLVLTVLPGRSELSRQALNQFLAGQIAPEVHEFGKIRMTRADISQWLQKLRTAKHTQERGVAVANLQNCAWLLLDTPAKAAALELLNQWVIPNAPQTRAIPRTSACSWENVIMGAYACYKKVGDLHGERRTLELLSTQARDPGLRDLAKFRLAGLKADQGRLKEAMDIVRKSDPKGELAEQRAKLLQTWEEQLKPKKPAP